MIKGITKIFKSQDTFTDKKRKLCDLKIMNIVDRIEQTTDKKTLKYLKRKLSRVKKECKELWR